MILRLSAFKQLLQKTKENERAHFDLCSSVKSLATVRKVLLAFAFHDRFSYTDVDCSTGCLKVMDFSGQLPTNREAVSWCPLLKCIQERKMASRPEKVCKQWMGSKGLLTVPSWWLWWPIYCLARWKSISWGKWNQNRPLKFGANNIYFRSQNFVPGTTGYEEEDLKLLSNVVVAIAAKAGSPSGITSVISTFNWKIPTYFVSGTEQFRAGYCHAHQNARKKSRKGKLT